MMVVRLLSNWGSVTFQGLTSGGPQEILPNLLEYQVFFKSKNWNELESFNPFSWKESYRNLRNLINQINQEEAPKTIPIFVMAGRGTFTRDATQWTRSTNFHWSDAIFKSWSLAVPRIRVERSGDVDCNEDLVVKWCESTNRYIYIWLYIFLERERESHSCLQIPSNTGILYI